MKQWALILPKTTCVEYLLLRPELWPDILRNAAYVDTGPYRTYTLPNAVPDSFFSNFIFQLQVEQRYYRWVEVSDNPIETPPDYETHHLPTED